MRIVNGITQGGWTDQWEIICPACGDDINLDYVTISPFLQRIRGPYASEAEGLAALSRHRGEIPATVTKSPDEELTVPNLVRPGPGRPAVVPAATESGAGERF